MTYDKSTIVFEPCPKSKKFRDFTNFAFHRLIARGFAGKNQHRQFCWWCECVCGKWIKASANQMTGGRTRSCGCYLSEKARLDSTTHGLRQHPLYGTWSTMKKRCYTPTATNYKDYGGRGITVCDRWFAFENFVADMGDRPTSRHTIERRDNNLGYSPDNCYWGTPIEQARNKRNTKRFTFKGQALMLVEWSEQVGVSISVLYHRINQLHWTLEKTFTTPVRRRLKAGRP